MQRGSQTLIGNIANGRELFLTKECLELELQGIKQMFANVEPQKQVGGPGILGDAALHQPVGLPLAIAASSVMAGALGGAQAGSKSKQNGFQSQPMLGSDPLTLHLAKMSRNQLNEVISDLKVMATKKQGISKTATAHKPTVAKSSFSGADNARNGDSSSVADA